MIRLRVGILGAGDMGKVHAGLLSADARVQIVAVADPDAQRARLLAAPSQAKSVGALEELFQEDIDVLFVTSPNFTHADASVAALERGIHVFCEKPMALNVGEGRRVLDATHRSRALYQLGFNRRFAPVYMAVQEKIQNGFLPYVADIKMNEGEICNRAWAVDTAKTGGHLNENVLHFLDMVQWLQGPIREIFAFGRANVYEDMTDMVLSFVTENDRLASISTSGHATWFYPWERMEVIGDHEALITEEVEKVMHSPGMRQEMHVTDFYQLSKEKKWGYAGEVNAFLDALGKGGSSAYTAEMGAEILQLVEACHESIRSGNKITMPPRERNGFIRRSSRIVNLQPSHPR